MATHHLMQCGHSSNAVDGEGKPCCAICFGSGKSDKIAPTPDLKGRMAKCSYCKALKESSLYLAFFEYLPNEATDRFYCGCRGWD